MNSNSTKKFSNKQESMVANFLSWERVPASGARMTPGDVISSEYLGECKTHVNSENAIKFNIKVWKKLEQEAMSQFKRPVYFVDDGSQTVDNTWAIVNTRWYSNCCCKNFSDMNIGSVSNSSISFNSSELYKKFYAEGTIHPCLLAVDVSNYKLYLTHIVDFRDMVG